MIRTLSNTLILLMAALLLGGLTSCVFEYFPDDEPDVPVQEEEANVYLTLRVGVVDGTGSSATTYSRAADGSYYFELPERDNEKLHTLRVYILNAVTNQIQALRLAEFNPDGTLKGSNLTFRLNPGRKRIILIANDASLPAYIRNDYTSLASGQTFPLSVLSDRQIFRTGNTPLFTTADYIPMCETFDLDLQHTEGGTSPSYVTRDLFVTRIAVKYTFIFADDVEAVSVRLGNMAKTQYFMPRGVVYDPGKYQPAEEINGIFGRNITAFTGTDTDKVTFEAKLTGKTPVQVTQPDGTKVTAYAYDPIYLMESSGNKFNLSICLDQGVTGPTGSTLAGNWFEYQTLPNLPLLPRNTHVIVNMSATYGLHCTVDVVPYRGCILNPYFGLPR